MKIKNALSLACVAGMVAPAMAGPRDMELESLHDVHDSVDMGSVYINAATNERVISLRTGVVSASPRGTFEPLELWVMDNRTPCAQFDPDYLNTFSTSIEPAAGPYGRAYLDWGDIPPDTIVDGFLFQTAAQSPVAAAGDGVPGLDAVLFFNDGDNGFNTCERINLLQITVTDLPGNSGQFTIESYRITVDLNNLAVFELGDSDGNDQGTGLHNPLSFIDYDGDNRHDWSYAIRIVQPDTGPVQTLLALSAPRGEFTSVSEYVVDQSFPDGSPTEAAGTGGSENGWDRFLPTPDPADALQSYDSTRTFGGLTCDATGPDDMGNPTGGPPDGVFDGTTADRRPWAGFSFALYGPAGVPIDIPVDCPADFNGDDNVNFNDVVGFLGAFNSQDPAADFNEDGVINFNDVVGFLGAFNAGCP